MARLLIIEDEILIAQDLSEIVTGFGHEVVGIARDAQTAMSVAQDEDIHVAFVDIMIEGDRDGVSVACHLREEFGTGIIFVTSHADEATVTRASAVGPVGYLVKPFTEESIFATLVLALKSTDSKSSNLDLSALSLASREVRGQLPKSVLARVQDFVRKNFDKELSLAELATEADMSESSFSRRFKSTVGMTPYQYVLSERIAEAKRLLRDTAWDISAVAGAVGFGGQSHFTTAFRKIVGVTPKTYRQL